MVSGQPRHSFRGPLLTPLHRNDRLIWARRVRRWQRRDWAHVLLSYESRFSIFRNDGRPRVYRRGGERLAPDCVLLARPFGGGGLIVWCGIYGDVKAKPVVIRGNLNAQRYCDDTLLPVAVPFIQQQPRGIIFQHDNSRPHTARLKQDFLANANVQVLPCPACSPDIYPIDLLWDHVDRQIRLRRVSPVNFKDLERCLLGEWERITPNVISQKACSRMY